VKFFVLEVAFDGITGGRFIRSEEVFFRDRRSDIVSISFSFLSVSFNNGLRKEGEVKQLLDDEEDEANSCNNFGISISD